MLQGEIARGSRAFHPGPVSTTPAVDSEGFQATGSSGTNVAPLQVVAPSQADESRSTTGVVTSSDSVVDSGFASGVQADHGMPPPPMGFTLRLPPPSHATSSVASAGSRRSGKKRSHCDMSESSDHNPSGSHWQSPVMQPPLVTPSGNLNSFPLSGAAAASSIAPSAIASIFQQDLSVDSSEPSPSASKKTKKATAVVAVMGMQGSLNRLTDTIEKTMTAPEEKQVERKQMALRILEEQDGDLPESVQIVLMEVIRKDQGFADVYCMISGSKLKKRRGAWIKAYLRDNNLEAAVAAAADDLATTDSESDLAASTANMNFADE